MRIVTTGQVLRMTWWKGTDTMARDKLEMAMFKVKSREKARSVRCERRHSGVRVTWPVPMRMKLQIVVDIVWDVVRSHGRLSYRTVRWDAPVLLLQQIFCLRDSRPTYS